MTIHEKHKSIIEDFKTFDNWEDRYSYIIKLGKELNPLAEEFKTSKYKIDGCQSQVWMNARFEDGKIFIEADSDALIVKGLIAILIAAYSGFSPNEILSAPPDFLKEIGIDNHLSVTRKNGLGAMLKQIQLYAFAFKQINSK
jgi:cysteine desulfuration protein SufE